MRQPDILIYAQPIRSGKTTALQNWIADSHQCIGGVLTPDVDGKRMLYDIAEKQYHEFEIGEDVDKEVVQIGKFRFSATAFSMAKNILHTSAGKYDWLIVDEAGKLEVEQDKGLEPFLSQSIASYKQGGKGKLLLVVRDTLLDKAIKKYGLSYDMVIDKTFFG